MDSPMPLAFPRMHHKAESASMGQVAHTLCSASAQLPTLVEIFREGDHPALYHSGHITEQARIVRCADGWCRVLRIPRQGMPAVAACRPACQHCAATKLIKLLPWKTIHADQTPALHHRKQHQIS